MGFGFGRFSLFYVLFMIMFVLVLIMIAATLIKGIATWNKNNHSPRLNVRAKIVAKRCDVSHHMQGNAGDMSGSHGFHSTTSTRYYVTFEVDSKDRMEFSVSGSEYGMLAEGDEGELTFQGSRYIGFARMR